MVDVIWGVIAIWSAIVFVYELIKWRKWMPDDETLGGAVKSVVVYRFKMMIKMIVPGALTILGAMDILL